MADSGEAPQGLPEVGELLVGKYEVVGLLGYGGMGAVLEATHVQLGHRVALKVLLPEARKDSDTARRFQREARASARLSGPHVTRILDVSELPDGSPFIVMEKLTGHDLADEIEARGRMPYREIVDLMVEACAGIAEAHACGIIHRDLKPSNLFLSEAADGTRTVKLMDFGISKLTDDVQQALTQTHSTFGTPLYMSPEQVRSSKEVDARTDVWSVGIILYELVTGKLPFEGVTAVATIAAILERSPTAPREIVDDLPEDFERVILKALAKEPDERYASIKELTRALRPFGSKKKAGVSTAPPPPLDARTGARTDSGSGRRADQGETGKLSLAQTVRASTTGDVTRSSAKPLVVALVALVTAVVGSVVLYSVIQSEPTPSTTPISATDGASTADAASLDATSSDQPEDVAPAASQDAAGSATGAASAPSATSSAATRAAAPVPTGVDSAGANAPRVPSTGTPASTTSSKPLPPPARPPPPPRTTTPPKPPPKADPPAYL